MRERYTKIYVERKIYWKQKQTLANSDNHSFDKSQKISCTYSYSKSHLNNLQSNNPLKFANKKNYIQKLGNQKHNLVQFLLQEKYKTKKNYETNSGSENGCVKMS